jgi:RNA polymerase sigma-70 factor, ECF subfamily
LDSAQTQSAETELSGVWLAQLWREAEAYSVDLTKSELGEILLNIGAKYNYGFASGVHATSDQKLAFWQSLQLRDLALAHACALGRETAWGQFINRFREPLVQTAIAITRSADTGRELADSLYSELFGLTERGGQRQSPLASYSGRGSLKGFLRATLAQRNIDRHRRTRREAALPAIDPQAPPASAMPEPGAISQMAEAVSAILQSLNAEERFLLASWYLDRRTLREISRVLRVHEATISRRIQRLTSELHRELVKHLQSQGMSRAAAEEALGIDPRDIDINLRTLLQSSPSAAFVNQRAALKPKRT